jgi:hypothetical protein
MASKVVYAIYHPDSGLFYDGNGLSKLNAKTKFYNSEHNAKLADMVFVAVKITWDYLEKTEHISKLYIDIDKEHYNKTLQSFRCLKIVPVNLEYRTD